MASPPELILDARAQTAEGPVWDSGRGVLWWVDIPGCRVHRHRPGDGDVGFATPSPVGCLTLRAAGGLVLGLKDGVYTCEANGSSLERLAQLEPDKPWNRINDGKAGPDGAFWLGTMDEAEQRRRQAGLYRVDAHHQVTLLVADVTLSNGLDWSPDRSLFYFTDTRTGEVDVFDHDPATGAISRRRQFVRFDAEQGHPDGLCVDAEGHVWVALWGGWAVRRFTPSGAPDGLIEMPCSQVSCPAFGGPDLDDLYITTARKNLGPEQLRREPAAGGVFRCRPGVRGQPTRVFAG
ncbi:MAG: SMP-30/gluconolactonase/LRE family protein [Candidatus Dormibacteraeota bacterium]|nr:SMP-30/gluconolactonase/LRE family protein [Candidatus Dormibacteraeota bacterium]